jgi:CHAT domain-containing protein
VAGCRQPAWQQIYDVAHDHLQQGYYSQAIKQAQDAYTQTAPKDLVWAWKFRLLEAEALLRDQQEKKSLELLRENPPSNFPPEITVRKRILQGQALCLLGRTADSGPVFNEAEGLLPPNSPGLEGELIYSRGRCSFSQPAAAIRYFQKAAELTRSVDPYIAVSSLGNIGHLMSQDNKMDEAIEWTEKAVPLMRAANSLLLEEKIMGNLGNSYSVLGDFKRAIETSEIAQRIAAKIDRGRDEEAWLVTLGRSYAAIPGDYTGKIEPSYLRALSIARKLQDEDIVHRSLHNLAVMSLKDNDIKKAKDYWQQEAATVAQGSPAELDVWLDEALIAIAEKDLKKAMELLQRIDKDPRTVPDRACLVQQEMGKIYWKENRADEADRMFQRGVHTVEKKLSSEQKKYWGAVFDNHSLLFDSYIRFLIARGQTVRALEVAEHLREVAQELSLNAGNKRLNMAEIQSRLKGSNQVILDYQVTDEKSFLWLITANSFQLFDLPSHHELHGLIHGYNKAIQEERRMEDSPAGQELYKALVQPAEKFIPKGAHVSIVPSKVLCFLNFETLIVPGPNPHYWIEDVVVQNAGSLARAARPSLVVEPGGSNELLLMGAPEEVNPEFKVLQHAGEEIERVGKHFPARQEKIIAGPAATPEAYRTSHPEQYRIMHFVTHGIPNEYVPVESAIVLSGTDISYKLYARDIIAIPLHAELVTISACYGVGNRWYVSEGTEGLAWAFIQAGAHQVVAALWEVDDASTPALMDDFYGEITRHSPTADALRKAKLAMLHSTAHKLPYYWGSLQLYIGS